MQFKIKLVKNNPWNYYSLRKRAWLICETIFVNLKFIVICENWFPWKMCSIWYYGITITVWSVCMLQCQKVFPLLNNYYGHRLSFFSIPNKVLLLCFKLYGSRDPSVRNTANVAIRQVVQTMFDRLNQLANQGMSVILKYLCIKIFCWACLTWWSC